MNRMKVLAVFALAVVIAWVAIVLGVIYAAVVAVVVIVPAFMWWLLHHHPHVLAITLFTVVTPLVVVWASTEVWGAADAGTAWLTLIAFALAAPLGAWLIPSRRLPRWVTVGLIDAGLVMVATIGPAAPAWTPVLAVLALATPLVIQPCRPRKVHA